MREIKIKSAQLTNFRGHTFRVDFNDSRTDVAGYNGTGKTTLFVAVKWCLTGVDELNRTNYDLFDSTLPFSPENANWAVSEVTVDCDGVEYMFKRQAKPKWVRPRGSSEYVKDKSDEYKFYVDDLEVAAATYRDKVVEVFGMDVEKLKLALDIRYYQMLDWRDLRKHFAEIVGSIDESEFKGDYTSVMQYLEKYKDSEKAKDYMRQQIAPLKQQIAEIEADIKATNRQLPDLCPVDDAERQIAEKKARIEEINKEILGLEEANKPYVEKRNDELAEIRALKNQYNDAEDAYNAKLRNAVMLLESQLSKADDNNAEIKRIIKSNERAVANRKAEIKMCREDIEYLEQEVAKLREQNMEMKAREFSDTVCPKCGQELPADQIAQLRTKFYEGIDKQRASIVERGKKTVERLEIQKSRLAKLESEKGVINNAVPAYIDTVAITEQINKLRADFVPFNQTDEAKSILNLIDDRVASLTEVPAVDSAKLQDESRQLVQDIEGLAKIVVRRDTHDKCMRDIKSYEDGKRNTGVELAKWEGILNKLIEREREWADTVRNRANEYLEHSHVEMVEIAKSGALVDTCTLTINSVDRGSTNHANKTIIGIDISNALCKRYGVNVPVFIDDFEHFTSEIPDTHGRQVVTLSADKRYPELTIL